MPFDKESFIKGYLIGVNLSRAPGGQGRKPDIPHGKYILAEDGTPIITETLSSTDVTIYPIGDWYLSNNTEYPYQRIYHATSRPEAPQVYVVFATPRFTSGSDYVSYGIAIIYDESWTRTSELRIESKRSLDDEETVDRWFAYVSGSTGLIPGYRTMTQYSGSNAETYFTRYAAIPVDANTITLPMYNSDTFATAMREFLGSLAPVHIITE